MSNHETDSILEKPYVKILAHLPSTNDYFHGRVAAHLQSWVDSEIAPLSHDIFGEDSVQIYTKKAPDGSTSSLHDLRVGDNQLMHVHLPSHETEVDASVLEDNRSRRVLFVVTGEKEGEMTWFKPTGTIEIKTEAGVPVATGDTQGKKYVMRIPPYSMAMVEIAGGVHNFRNLRAHSYHPYNPPRTSDEGDDLTANTVAWKGKQPREVVELKAENIDEPFEALPLFHGPNSQSHQAIGRILDDVDHTFHRLVERGPHQEPPATGYIESVLHNNGDPLHRETYYGGGKVSEHPMQLTASRTK